MPCHAIGSSRIKAVSRKEIPCTLTRHHISLKEQADPVCIVCDKLHIMRDHKDSDPVSFELL